jgi:hypothetical protein
MLLHYDYLVVPLSSDLAIVTLHHWTKSLCIIVVYCVLIINSIRVIIKKAQILVLQGWNVAKAKLYMCFFIDRKNEV